MWVWKSIIKMWSNTFRIILFWGWGWGWGWCTFDWVYQAPSWLVSWTTCQEWIDLHFPSQPPSMSLRWAPSFGLYEVGQVLVTPLIEWRWQLWANPPGVLIDLSITQTGFTQPLPTPWTWYWNNDTDITIILWNTKIYNWQVNDDQLRTANATWSYRGSYPYFWTSIDIITLTKQTLLPITNSYFPVNMVAETWGDKYKADFESINVAITGIEFFNTISWSWEWMWGSKANSLTLWTTSSVTQTVQWNIINYTRFTHNWPNGWALQVRFYRV